jgi:elongation factor G
VAKYATAQVRNVALIAHNGAGKTSLADALFFTAGGASRQGSVNEKSSASDFEPEEQKRGSSIQTAILPCDWKGHKVNIIDTPGYPDFRGEMLSGLRVADAAILVISATSGIEVGTRQAWEYCEKLGLPRAVVINKLDRENTDFDATVRQITEAWGRQYVPVQYIEGREAGFKAVLNLLGRAGDQHPKWRARLMEAVAESDDKLAEKFIETEKLEFQEMIGGLKAAIARRTVVPVYAASALKNIGPAELLDAIITYFPAPSEKTEGVGPGVQANLVFKTAADPFVGKLSYFRVYGAPFKGDSQLWNSRRGEPERIGQVFQPRGKEQQPVQDVITGDIGVVSRLSHTQTFDTLCDKAHPVTLPGADLPEPVFGLAVTPKDQVDLDKMANALARLAEEDPTLRVERNADTKETVIWGLGDIQVETAIERIRRKFDCNLVTSLPRVPYRETIGGTTTVEYKHKKQAGGRGQFGHVFLRLEPLARGQGVQFSSKVAGGNVPKEYIPAVEKGVRHAAAGGVVAGFPLVDLHVTITDGSSHSVDSSGMAFEIAGSMGLKKGVMEARPQLLEPVLNVTVLVPEENAGAVMGDLNTRRARIHGMEQRGGGLTEIKADAPQSTMRRYAADLRSMTQARGTFATKFAHYDVVPHLEAQKIIEASAKHPVGA